MKFKNILLILILILAAASRLLFLDGFPAGLNADEAAIGYNVYSLLETGKDEHGNSWPLVFRSFDDYKPAGYFYLVLPFVKLFGLDIWSVRLPSAILGIITVYFIYLFVNKLFENLKNENSLKIENCKLKIGYLAALLLCLSPWHLQFSRGGWEVNAATCFLVISLYFFLKALDKPVNFLFYTLFSLLSLYTYHSMRLIIPFLGLFLLIFNYHKIFSVKSKKYLSLSLVIGLVLVFPLVKQMLSPAGTSRFTGVSVFADSGPLWEALSLRQEHATNPNSIFVRLIHNQYLTYSLRFAKNYLSHFSPRFLFVIGDEIARSKVPGFGQSYLFLAPFFFLGLFFAPKFILFWLLIAPLAAALTFQSPHALRAQNMVIPLNIIIAFGIFKFVEIFKTKYLITILYSLFTILLLLNYTDYAFSYFVRYPNELPYAWEYGFDQVADYVKQNENKYDQIIISDRFDQPYIIMAFYLKYPPQKFQQEIKLEPRDQFGFSTVRSFGKFRFRPINYDQDKSLPNTLLIALEESVPENKIINRVYSPSGAVLFKFVSTN